MLWLNYLSLVRGTINKDPYEEELEENLLDHDTEEPHDKRRDSLSDSSQYSTPQTFWNQELIFNIANKICCGSTKRYRSWLVSSPFYVILDLFFVFISGISLDFWFSLIIFLFTGGTGHDAGSSAVCFLDGLTDWQKLWWHLAFPLGTLMIYCLYPCGFVLWQS